jgi:hypothetical protein
LISTQRPLKSVCAVEPGWRSRYLDDGAFEEHGPDVEGGEQRKRRDELHASIVITEMYTSTLLPKT